MKKYLIYFYLDWFDNFTSIESFAEANNITIEDCRVLLEMGRKFKLEETNRHKEMCRLLLNITPEPPEPKEVTRKELELWRKENELLLRNWGYRGLKDKIAYKCKKVGIELEIEKVL